MSVGSVVRFFEDFPEDPVLKPCLIKSPAVDKTCVLSAIPFHVTGLKPPRSGAPVFNSHESVIRKRGFQEAGHRRFLPRHVAKAPTKALEGVLVVELPVGDCLGIRAAGAILADYGATVVTCNMLPDSHYERGKQSVTVSEIDQMFRDKKVTGVMCEQSEDWLRDNGLDVYLADEDTNMVVLKFNSGESGHVLKLWS